MTTPMPIQLLALLLAAAAQTPGKDHVKVQLALVPPTAAAGGETRARLQFAIDPGWHIYPHDFTGTGNKTVVEAKFPDGITLGELNWPAPTILDLFNEKTPVHEGEITAEGIVSVASSVKPGSYELGFELTYQVCSSVCVDGKKSLTATLVVTAPDPNKPVAKAADEPAAKSAAKRDPTPTKQKPLAGVSLAAPSTYDGKLGVEMELSKDGLGPGEEALLEVKLAIGPGWHAYSPKSESGGQIPISITLEGLEKWGRSRAPRGPSTSTRSSRSRSTS